MNFSIIYDIGNGRKIKVDVFQPLAYTNLPAEVQQVSEITEDDSAQIMQN